MKMYICVMIWALPAMECGVGLFMIMICSSLVLSRNVYGCSVGIACGELCYPSFGMKL